MKTWNYIDKSDWPDGLWMNEPDKAHWIDEYTDLDCLIVRGPSGALCGYVGVPPDHELHKVCYNDVYKKHGYYIDVHGCLTFSDSCQPHKDNPEHGICHIAKDGRAEDVWWFGFDCAHGYDICPRYAQMYSIVSIYRPFDYVKRQVELLAMQINHHKGGEG